MIFAMFPIIQVLRRFGNPTERAGGGRAINPTSPDSTPLKPGKAGGRKGPQFKTDARRVVRHQRTEFRTSWKPAGDGAPLCERRMIDAGYRHGFRPGK